MPEFQPVTTLAELDALDEAEVVEGYLDGRDGGPEPGNNRSRSFWHGWRCGQMDQGALPIPDEHRALTRQWLDRERAALRARMAAGEVEGGR